MDGLLIEFRIQIEPKPKGRPRFNFNSRHAYTPEDTRSYETDLKWLLGPHRPTELLEGPLQLALEFGLVRPKSNRLKYPSVKPDLDNFEKAVMDAMEGIFFKNDSQIIAKFSTKVWTPAAPYIQIRIQSLP